ncbi:MAG: hypothetical protein IJY14_02450 [Acholeplasmatales bacterium]|nr:hypothetical protein [Acholeplasmatales bacterium]
MNIIKNYKLADEEIKKLNIPLSEKISTGIIAFLISGLLISGPICLSINLIMFKYYLPLLFLFIATLILIFAVLFNYLYLKGITKGNNKNIKYIVLANTIALAITIYILAIVIIILFT